MTQVEMNNSSDFTSKEGPFEEERLKRALIAEENLHRLSNLEEEVKCLRKEDKRNQTALWLDEELIFLQVNEISDLQARVKGLKESVNKGQVALEGSQHRLSVTKKILRAQQMYVKKLRLKLHQVREQNRKLKRKDNL